MCAFPCASGPPCRRLSLPSVPVSGSGSAKASTPDATRHPARVPVLLEDLAGWAWRLLLVGFTVYVVVRVLGRFYLVVLPFIGSLFITALLLPFVRWLRARGMRRGLATGLVMLGGLAVLGLIAWFVTDQVSAQYSDLVDQLSASLHRLRNGLVGGPLHVRARSVDNLQSTMTKWLDSHRGAIASGVVTGVGVVSETLIGVVLALFTTFFMLFDGERIWAFCAGLLPVSGQRRATEAAGSAWLRISGFVRGTFIIAVFHGVVMGVALAVMRVPLAIPLALLVFLGSFIPIEIGRASCRERVEISVVAGS